MRVLVQRVSRAAVRVGGEMVGEIEHGLVALVGVRATDSPRQAEALARKLARLRIFGDNEGRLNRSLLDVGGAVLSVPQFTLYADTSRGRRPSFIEAAPAEQGRFLYEAFNAALRVEGIRVETGRFGARMRVEIHNEGPVTILLEEEGRAETGEPPRTSESIQEREGTSRLAATSARSFTVSTPRQKPR